MSQSPNTSPTEYFNGYPVIERPIVVAGRTYRLVGPANYEQLIDDPRVVQRFAQDEFMPYWAEFWPAARLLAEEVASWDSPAPGNAPTVLEIGCGLGLVGLVAHALGYRVTISDYDQDALAFVRESARRSGLPEVATAFVDWRERYPTLVADRIVAAEVLYEQRSIEPVSAFLRDQLAPGGRAWLVDRNRRPADAFVHTARRMGLHVLERPIERPAVGDGPPLKARIFEVTHAT